MENIKVEVNNRAESKEVQELFFELGCGWHFGDIKDLKNLDMPYLYAFAGSKEITCSYIKSSFINHDNKEITIPQLRDMVVLKRNDVGDATHVANFKGTDEPFFVSSSKDVFIWWSGNHWAESGIRLKELKPIEKKEMKEYLIPDNDGYRIAVHDAGLPIAEDWIEIPEGANICINGYFYKDENTALIGGGWMDCHKTGVKTVSAMINTGGEIIWQRSEIESLSDQCVGIEQVRQDTVKVTIDEFKHLVYKKDVSHLKIVDVYRVLELFDVKSHAIGHAIKKLLLSGDRGAKDEAQDIQEAIDSLVRYQEMKNEDK